MANRRLARDVQTLQRHVHADFDGQVRITEVDDNLDYISLDVEPNSGPYQGARLNFRVSMVYIYFVISKLTCTLRYTASNADSIVVLFKNNK